MLSAYSSEHFYTHVFSEIRKLSFNRYLILDIQTSFIQLPETKKVSFQKLAMEISLKNQCLQLFFNRTLTFGSVRSLFAFSIG